MNRAKKLVSVLGVLGLVSGTALGLGCREEGPMERAGATVDEKIDAVSDKLGGHESGLDRLGEKLDAAAESVREKIEAAEESAGGR
jgi:hypothetical protein